MAHPLNNLKTRSAGLAGAAVLALGLLAPVAASADRADRVQLTIDAGAVQVSHYGHDRYRHKNRYRHEGRYRHHDRVSRRGYDSRYFVRPHRPLNFKHWLRVERQLHAYTPNTRHLNRYELRQVLGHGYDRYLRDHHRWSKRADRRQDRFLARNDHDHRYCNDRRHRHYRRW